jgi:hypothetical protein
MIDAIFGFGILEISFLEKWTLISAKKLQIVFPLWISTSFDFAAVSNRSDFIRRSFEEKERYNNLFVFVSLKNSNQIKSNPIQLDICTLWRMIRLIRWFGFPNQISVFQM